MLKQTKKKKWKIVMIFPEQQQKKLHHRLQDSLCLFVTQTKNGKTKPNRKNKFI